MGALHQLILVQYNPTHTFIMQCYKSSEFSTSTKGSGNNEYGEFIQTMRHDNSSLLMRVDRGHLSQFPLYFMSILDKSEWDGMIYFISILL